MARGGARPGAGRKKGVPGKKRFIRDEAKATPPAPLPDKPIMPLDYMLAVLSDASIPEERRDKMAALAAPYCHGKIEPVKVGKKEQRKEAADGVTKFGVTKAPSKIAGRIG